MSKLKEKIDNYAKLSEYKLLNKVPLIITINGRSFSKLTALLNKPFSGQLAECFYSTLLFLVQEIEGSVFGYCFNDEIIIVARNDQHQETLPWCDNNVSKITSIASSLVTAHFNKCILAKDLNLIGDPVFYSHVFTVPNISEAINVILSKQQQCLQSSIYYTCFYELLNKYDKNDIKDILAGTTIDDKINLLNQESNVNFNAFPSAFKRGIACYRSPKLINYDGMEIIKNKWILNNDLPIFTKDHSFLQNIFNSGSDIIRNESF